MKLNPLTPNTWRPRHHGRCPMPLGRVPSSLEFHPSTQASTIDHLHDTPFPWDRRPHLPDCSSNSTAPDHSQKENLALQTEPSNSNPGVQEAASGVALQKSEAQEEIIPEDIRYRLGPLAQAPLQLQTQHSSSHHFKPRWLPFSTTYGGRSMPWKTESKTFYGEKPYHSVHFTSPCPGAFQFPEQLPVLGFTNPAENNKKQGLQDSLPRSPPGNVWLQGEHNVSTTHQISFQSPLLGLSILPIHTQGRKVAPIVHRGHAEYVNQYKSDSQAPARSQVLPPNPDKASQRIDKYIQHVHKRTVGGQQRTAGVHHEPSRSQQEMATPDGKKSMAKFDGNTVPRTGIPPLPDVLSTSSQAPGKESRVSSALTH